MTQAEIARLPTQKGNGSGPLETCCICMEDMKPNETIARLPACLHTFHRSVPAVFARRFPELSGIIARARGRAGLVATSLEPPVSPRTDRCVVPAMDRPDLFAPILLGLRLRQSHVLG